MLSQELDTVSANKHIKDGVFRLLFENPTNAAELYYALTGENANPDEIQIITITTVISGKLKNDLAFVVREKVLVVGEHMSSPYANMPIRLLMYIGQLYEKWIKMRGDEKFLYRSKLYKIPAPAFVVFYNGADPKPEKELLKLSSAFEISEDESLGLLELEVPVYNINKGMNEGLFEKSPRLKQYAEFIAKLREFTAQYNDYTRAVKEAVTHCIANNVLADFLKEQGGKIVSLLTMEYDVEVAKKVYAEERVEERVEDIAIEMLREGDTIEKIIRITKLPEKAIQELKNHVSPV